MTEETERSMIDRDLESVLTDVKDFCGVNQEDTDFDSTICGCIDTVMATLCQLGVVPRDKLQSVRNDSLKWTDFFSDPVELSMAKSYVRAKVRLMFDPPASSTILNAFKEQCAEYEWRAQFAVEYPVSNNPE